MFQPVLCTCHSTCDDLNTIALSYSTNRPTKIKLIEKAQYINFHHHFQTHLLFTMTSDEETGPQSRVRDMEVVQIEGRDNVVEPNNDKKAKKPCRSKSTDLSKLDYSQAPQQLGNVCVNRHKAINAVNTYKKKVNGARTKFEEVSRSV